MLLHPGLVEEPSWRLCSAAESRKKCVVHVAGRERTDELNALSSRGFESDTRAGYNSWIAFYLIASNSCHSTKTRSCLFLLSTVC